MQRFKNILLVYDDSESKQSALARAIDLAKINQARLTVIQVITHLPRDYRMLITSLPPKEVMEIAVKEHTQLLEQHIEHYLEDIQIQSRVVVGREFIEIIKEVLRHNYDLVIKTARGTGGKVDILFGSTAMHLLRKCPCPVWLIKPDQDPHFLRIMAAVDVAPPEIEENNLNNKIIELATSLTRMENSELHIVYAWEKWDTKVWTNAHDHLPSDKSILHCETKDMPIKWMDDFLAQYDLQQLQHHEHVLPGLATEVIPEFAEQHQIDLIVMGTVGRIGIPGFFIGNTAEKILQKIDCSVLTVKPDGFITPVLDNQ